jgi:methionyl aminopeptidase
MREAGQIVAGTLNLMKKSIEPGTTTAELDRLAEDYIRSHDAEPAFKGLYGFPASICASINDEVVHGIPGDRRLKEGDILSIDVGVERQGFNGDAAATFPVGEVSPEVQELLEATQEALEKGIAQALAGNHLSDISHAIQSNAEARGFSVVREYVGHGIGRDMHEDPQIPNFGPPGRGPLLKPGMTLALEPMLNMGTHSVQVDDDQWTVRTGDGNYSAHFEHTVAVLEDGNEVFTG